MLKIGDWVLVYAYRSEWGNNGPFIPTHESCTPNLVQIPFKIIGLSTNDKIVWLQYANGSRGGYPWYADKVIKIDKLTDLPCVFCECFCFQSCKKFQR